MDYKKLIKISDDSSSIRVVDGELRHYHESGGIHFDRLSHTHERYDVLATQQHPIAVYETNNPEDRYNRSAARQISGAELVKSWERGNFTDDPYGNKVRHGSIKCEIWDFRAVFGITEPMEKFLSYELKEFLKNQ